MFVTSGVLVSHRHIASAKKIQGYNVLAMHASDGKSWRLKSKAFIRMYGNSNDFAVVLELTQPVDISASSPYSPICIPKAQLGDYFSKTA